MAAIHKGKQSLGRRAGKNFCLSAACGGFFLYCVFLALTGALPLFFCFFLFLWLWAAAVYWRRYRRLCAGAAGERLLLKELRHLPGSYHVFTNYVMRFDGWSDEADFVVVGENGVFVIEAKHYAGVIEGRAGEPKWRQEKLKAKGRMETRQIKNPLEQTERHLKNVAKILKQRRFAVSARAILVFTNPNVRLRIEAQDVFVIRGCGRLSDIILGCAPAKKLAKDEVKAIAGRLREAL